MFEPLTHYIVVRRDLPLGEVLAQLAHAAGESFFLLGTKSESGRSVHDGRGMAFERTNDRILKGLFRPHETIAIVLGARNEHRLRKLEQTLLAHQVPHVAVVETDGALAGQLCAIGLLPASKGDVAHHVADFHMLRELDAPKRERPPPTPMPSEGA